MNLSKNHKAAVFIGITLLISSCAWNLIDSKKINGASFVAPSRPISLSQMAPISELNANWVAITPYAFSPGNSPIVTHDHKHQWWGEKVEGTSVQIKYAHELGLKVMLKPHVWIRGQGWAGDFRLDDEQQWSDWEESYSDYILTYTRVADSLNVEMFCIGTEYRNAAATRPDYWRELISEVRSIYHGKVVYAANWDNYQNIQFWDQLDYIGIDAYFPLSEQKSPSIDHLIGKWNSTKTDIKSFSGKWDKPILFTEFGYQSIDYATDGHWKYDQDTLSVNMGNQVIAYQALFDTFWNEPWFHGGFLWKWHADYSFAGGVDKKQFTPQNKPALKTIADWYGRY